MLLPEPLRLGLGGLRGVPELRHACTTEIGTWETSMPRVSTFCGISIWQLCYPGG